jgi:hypothetical protein
MNPTVLLQNVIADSVKFSLSYKLLDLLQIGRYLNTGNDYANQALENFAVSQSSNIVNELTRKFLSRFPLLSSTSVPSGMGGKEMIIQTISDTVSSVLLDLTVGDMIAGPDQNRRSSNVITQTIAYLRLGLMFVITRMVSNLLQQQYYNVLGLARKGILPTKAYNKSILY